MAKTNRARASALVSAALLAACLLPAATAPSPAAALSWGRSTVPAAAALAVPPDSDVSVAIPIKGMPAARDWDTPASGTFGDSLAAGDRDDVFYADLWPGQTLKFSVTSGNAGSEIVVDLYPPGTPSVHDFSTMPIASSAGLGYPQTLAFVAGTYGRYYVDVWGTATPYTATWSVTPPPILMQRTYGSDRYQTAIAVSKAAFAAGASPSVVLARGDDFADALSASALAGSYGCPILLTKPSALPGGVLAEIDRLRGSAAGTVYVVGSTGAVSSAVVETLTSHGLEVRRIWGTDRFATAARVADEVRAHETSAGRTPATAAFVVNGLNFPDGVAASPYAARMRMPILLVKPSIAPTATTAELTALGITHVYVVGGTSAVSDAVKDALPVVVTTRVSGGDRYQTARALADLAVTSGWAETAVVGVATGANFPDALGGGAALARSGGALVLTRKTPLSADASAFIHTHRATLTGLRVFGSTGVVADSDFGALLGALKP
jgi:lactocepin